MKEINLAEVIRLLLADKKKLIIWTVVAAVVGVLLAFATPKKYKTTVMLAPESSGGLLSGNISSLASLVGMNMKMGQNTDAIYPEIYPDLVGSSDFLVGLFDTQITRDKTGETMSYFKYLHKHQKYAFWEYPLIWAVNLKEKLTSDSKKGGRAPGENVDPFRLLKPEASIVKLLRTKIKCSVDKKTDVITIDVTDQDPLVSALIADSVQQHLQLSIIDYRTKKARIDYNYLSGLCAEAKNDYDNARHIYSAYADANQNVNLQSYKSKEEDLKNDMDMKYGIYTTLIEQQQIAKAKVQERTPAFTVVQSASVPYKHSNMPKAVVLVLWAFLGFVVRGFVVLWKNRTLILNQSPEII